MKIYLGLTEDSWYENLKEESFDEVNFWRPNISRKFRALDTNEMFLFKLHSPSQAIVGGGFFVRYSLLPSFLAWDIFGPKNGVKSLKELDRQIIDYSKSRGEEPDMKIGSIILSEPFFFQKGDWIDPPSDWDPNTPLGRVYNSKSKTGKILKDEVINRFKTGRVTYKGDLDGDQLEFNLYGKEEIIIPSLGPSSFRISVTESYNRRCAISGEGILPILDVSHFKAPIHKGPSINQNGILLRKDLNILFEKGYISIDQSLRVMVSPSLKKDYNEKGTYLNLEGKPLVNLPKNKIDYPAKEFIRWHNERVFL